MRSPHSYIFNALRVCYIKLKYGKRLSMGIIQTFKKIKIELHGHSVVRIGNYNQNRGNLYIGVHNGKLSIGSHCFFNINNSITCMEEVKIGDYCKFGNNVVIVDHDHNFRTKSPEFLSKPILIGDNVWVGANVTILRGSEIGDNCVIGAGSVVRGKVPRNSIYLDKSNIKIKSL